MEINVGTIFFYILVAVILYFIIQFLMSWYEKIQKKNEDIDEQYTQAPPSSHYYESRYNVGVFGEVEDKKDKD